MGPRGWYSLFVYPLKGIFSGGDVRGYGDSTIDPHDSHDLAVNVVIVSKPFRCVVSHLSLTPQSVSAHFHLQKDGTERNMIIVP